MNVLAVTQSLFVTTDVEKSRLTECRRCPAYNKRFHQCRDCGCLLMFKAKLSSTLCPRRKWKW